MPPKRDHQLLIDAARMYYIDGLDQGQIGRRLGLSRSSVSRTLAEAREKGIVQVRIAGDDHIARNRDLEAALVLAFGLREARVAEASARITPLKSVGMLAAKLFTRRAARADRIGFSWGFTIGTMIAAIPQLSLRPGTRLTPLVGGMPVIDSAVSGNMHIQVLAEKCGLSAERFDAPAVVESAATYHAMMSESSVQAALERARACDLAFIGIGSFGVHTSRHVIEAMRLTPDELVRVQAAHPVGDVMGRFFDIDGVPLGSPTTERVIGITIEEARQIEVAVAVAAGRDKAPGLLGALRTGVFDAVVVDEALAAAILAADAGHPSALPPTL